MKKQFLRTSMLVALLGATGVSGSAFASERDGTPVTIRYVNEQGAPILRATSTLPGVVTFDGTGATATLEVVSQGLEQDITLKTTPGFKVSLSKIKAGNDEPVQIVITNTSSLANNTGQLILRSGDIRTYVNLVSTGTPLAVKDIAANPVYAGGTDAEKSFDGLGAAKDGYTLEFKAKVDEDEQKLSPFAVTSDKVGFQGYVSSTGMGLNNSSDTYISNKGISNPANGGTFYNTDGLYHTYRYAVTPDERVFVYRDGLPVDTTRVSDLALQPGWSVDNGDMKENLIKNPGFEGEWNFSKSRNIVDKIEGWDVYPYDQYNSTQEIVTSERDNEVDQNNHVLSLKRYTWNAGWSAGEISQIVDVAPNETYSFSALAKGGLDNSGKQFASLRIQDLQNADNKVVIPVTSSDWQTYAADFTTLANTKQIRVICYLERDKWGSSVKALNVDDVKLTGMSRTVKPQLGFHNEGGADLKYFAFDNTGAYAPAVPVLSASKDSISIDGTGKSEDVDITLANLISDVKVSATGGLEVSPTLIKKDAGKATITVKNLTSLADAEGQVILRSGDVRTYVKVNMLGTPLAVKDISANPVYAGGTDAEKSFDGLGAAKDGYTLEFKAKVDEDEQKLSPFAVTSDKVGFQGYVSSTGMGLNNSSDTYISNKGISNPANGGTFYNTDGLYHTYRYAVTPDERVFVYRDGLPVDTTRVSDLALQPGWSVDNGDMKENLIKNPGFEGEWNFSKSRNIVDKIEGWDVYPYDQYNSTQEIVTSERDNEVDQNNHVLSLKRYTWNAGWSAGEISQIVDVAPNETYSFSALAKGGLDNSGKQFASLRIQDLQNADNKVVIPVTSSDWQTYAADFTTLANTKQIRVICYLERDKWGSSVKALNVDDVKLTGMSRTVKPQLGFHNEGGADLKYFAFDNTGAYAPMMPGLTAQEIQTAIKTVDNGVAEKLNVTITNGTLVLQNVEEGSRVLVYNAAGSMVASDNKYVSGKGIELPTQGIYVVAVCHGSNRQVCKVRY